MKPAARLNELGQSAWLDLIGRKLIQSGELKRMIDEDGIRGVTANPAIFEKAIVETNEYDAQLKKLVEQAKAPLEIYETMAIDDVRAACDVLRPLFDKLQGGDGFVSLEVSPYIARDTKATIAEAKRFWAAVDRPNLFIKIPANPEGIPAIREATAAGISINITLIFSVRVYQQVIDAYMGGLKERVLHGEPISGIHSVASFFVSRVDSAVDKLLEAKGDKELQGKIANANAKEAYQLYLQSIASPRWKALEAKGATRQRPLWASTGTKNKAYSDVLYVEPLIGRDTVNTLPLATLHAFNDHGKPAETVTQGVPEARAQLKRLVELGIDLEKVCAELTEQGLDLFSKALDGLLHAIEARATAQRSWKELKLRESLGRRKDDGARAVETAREKKIASRLPSPAIAAEQVKFASESSGKFTHFVVLGSLAPAAEAMSAILGKREGGLELRTSASEDDPQRTVFVASPELQHKPGQRNFVEAKDPWIIASLLGHDPEMALRQVALASHQQVPLSENLAARIGAIAGGLALKGADKLTLLLSGRLAPLGPWLAQRIAASGGAVVPIQGESVGRKNAYGDDRLFVSISLAGEPHDMGFLAEAGHPLLQWKLAGAEELIAEMARWEIAIAAMAAMQDAPAAQDIASESPQAEPSLRSQGLALFAAPGHAQVLRKAAGTLGAAAAASPSGWIAAHLALGDPGEAVALQSYLAPEPTERLHEVQAAIRDATQMACTLVGAGVLPKCATFLQLTNGDGPQSLQSRGRVLRIHLEEEKPDKLLQSLHDAVKMISKK